MLWYKLPQQKKLLTLINVSLEKYNKTNLEKRHDWFSLNAKLIVELKKKKNKSVKE